MGRAPWFLPGTGGRRAGTACGSGHECTGATPGCLPPSPPCRRGGGGYSQALRDSIQRAGDADILFIAAAGNDGTDNDVTGATGAGFYPATYGLANIISVASITSTGALSSFSNYGATTVDLGAVGRGSARGWLATEDRHCMHACTPSVPATLRTCLPPAAAVPGAASWPGAAMDAMRRRAGQRHLVHRARRGGDDQRQGAQGGHHLHHRAFLRLLLGHIQ